jgi:hypothetical protein
MSYVDAGYSAALATMVVYAISLGLRCRRWEQALKAADQDKLALPAADAPAEPVGPGGRS